MIFINRYWLFTIGLLITLSVTTQAYALRCGTRLVSTDDHFTEVLEKCGNPDHVTSRIEYKTYTIEHERYPFYTSAYGAITIEEWIYNFGRHRFMQLLRFENGRLKEISSLDYGY